ncbi:MAG TPA: hypothetical protein VFW96_14225 [Thermomicrobiales bacterium]|nr:hypothetical protein [Thermomicrobiales bacterium]
MPGELTPLEEDLLAALDDDELARHRERLTTLRAQAAIGRDRTPAYFRAVAGGWGLPLTLHRFEAAVGVPRAVRFSLARRDAPVEAIALPGSAATPPGGLTADLRVASDGDGVGDDLAGSVALVDGAPTPAGVARLAARGARGVVYISPDEAPRAMGVAGPSGEAAAPAVAIGRAAGEGFLALCAAGPTPVTLEARVEWQSRRLVLPVATIPGAVAAEGFVLVGAALGGADGFAGAAGLFELARALLLHAPRLRRGLRLAWWPDGATPDAAPHWYAGHAWAELAEGALAYVDVAVPAPDAATPGAALPLRWLAESACAEGGAARVAWGGTMPAGAAAAFAGAGLPALTLAAPPATPAPAAPARAIGLYAVTLARLCAYPLAPFDLPGTARALERRLEEARGHAGDADLAPLVARAAAFRAAAERLHLAALHVAQADATNYEEALERTNRALRRLNQTLVPLLHRAGDRYAPAPPTPALLPGLEGALALAADAADMAGAHRGRAAVTRERNRLADALAAATATIDDLLADLLALGIG